MKYSRSEWEQFTLHRDTPEGVSFIDDLLCFALDHNVIIKFPSVKRGGCGPQFSVRREGNDVDLVAKWLDTLYESKVKCKVCAVPIPEGRLEALPNAETCVKHSDEKKRDFKPGVVNSLGLHEKYFPEGR